MIGYVVRSGDQFKTYRSGWTIDVLAAVRFAREEDAQQHVDAPDEYVVPVLMSPQFPSEIMMVREAIELAERMRELRTWQYGKAKRAMRHAEHLCYELFKRALLRTTAAPAKVALPAKAPRG